VAYGRVPNIGGALPATAAVATNTTVVVAAGPGLYYRIAAASVFLNRAVTGVVDASLTNGVGGAVIAAWAGLQLTGTSGGYQLFPEPGLLLSDNAAIVINHIASVAAGSIRIVVYYFVDSVG
jgi:hypothetical protein